ncbi:DivIVA domain-containing protein [Nocardioides sp. GCM10027113]|uniref:DivIVA domain-containing protein n=1 Tax=unclassified Nocardioides TaxID=2615069 RepID=UPI00361E6546
MTWFLAILVVLALGGIAVVAAGRGTPMAEVYDDRPESGLPPERPLRPDDLRRVRFPLAFRGYRMAEVDALLDRLAVQLEGELEGQQEAIGWPEQPQAAAGAEPVAEDEHDIEQPSTPGRRGNDASD